MSKNMKGKSKKTTKTVDMTTTGNDTTTIQTSK